MRKQYSDMTADDLRKWAVRHKFMPRDGSVGEAVRRGAPQALRISDRQFYDYMSGKYQIPSPIALIVDFYDWYPKRVKRISEQEGV